MRLENFNSTESKPDRDELPAAVPTCDTIESPEGFDCKKTLRVLGMSMALAGAAGPSFATNESESGFELREQAIIESVFDTDTLEQMEAAGFRPIVKLEADGEAGYVVHFDQTHTDTRSDFHEAMNAGLMQSFQERMREVLPILASQHGGVVFAEGVAQDLSESKEVITDVTHQIAELVEEPDALNSVSSALTAQNYLNWYNKHATNRMVQNSSLPALIPSLQEKIARFVEDPGEVAADDQSDFEVLQAYISLNAAGTIGHTGFTSADMYGYMHDQFDIYPAETPEQNERGIAAQKKLEEARTAFNQMKADSRPDLIERRQEILQAITEDQAAGTETPDSQTAPELGINLEAELELVQEEYEQALALTPEATAVREAEREFAEEGHINREQVVYARIQEYEMQYGLIDNPLVVYGGKHEFEHTLQSHNANNDPTAPDRGLIKIESIPITSD